MQKTIKWGILGCGSIAHKFAHDLALVADSELVAVASRDISRAKAFGRSYRAKKCYGSYEALLNDPEVMVVYVATRHPYHASCTLLSLEHDKAVLCEKPFGMNAHEVLRMIQKAKDRGLFLMEALWTYFIPSVEKMMELIKKGRIGEVKMVHADFGFVGNPDPDGRLLNKELGGGSLLDIGIYPLFISLLTLGEPSQLKASASFSTTGVDESVGMLLHYPTGAMAILSSTFAVCTQVEALIHGTAGSIKLHRQFHHSSSLSIYEQGEKVEQLELPVMGHGYAHEIMHVNDCLKKGLKESLVMSHEFSTKLIRLLDGVRREIGLVY